MVVYLVWCKFVIMSHEEIKVSEEQKKWVKLLSEGKKNGEVAKIVNVNPSTFAYRMSILRARFNCTNTASLIAIFSKQGYI